MLWVAIALLMVGQLAFVLIREYCRPQKAVAWLVVLFLFPLIGLVFYVFVSPEYGCLAPERRKDKMKLDALKVRLTERCKQNLPPPPCDQTRSLDGNALAMLKNEQALPFTAYNKTTVYREGPAAFEAMFAAISSAKHHVHMEFYIIRSDDLGLRMRELLIQKAQEGVQIRILFDGIGSHRLRMSYFKPLLRAGAEIGCFAPPLRAFLNRQINYRNHRKILVVDGEVGFIGGLNIGDEYVGLSEKFGYWRDTHFRIEGNAVMWIQFAFAEDWCHVKRRFLNDPSFFPIPRTRNIEFMQIVKSGPDETILETIFSLIVSARERIYIETPYFVPDPGVLLALKTAARRGVDIRVIIPAVPDTKLVYRASLSYAEEMLRAGIRFYRYRKGFIHAKVLICDQAACSGSANMDMRSFTGQFELNAVFLDERTVRQLADDFFQDLHECEEILLPAFERRPRREKIEELFARLLSSLF